MGQTQMNKLFAFLTLSALSCISIQSAKPEEFNLYNRSISQEEFNLSNQSTIQNLYNQSTTPEEFNLYKNQYQNSQEIDSEKQEILNQMANSVYEFNKKTDQSVNELNNLLLTTTTPEQHSTPTTITQTNIFNNSKSQLTKINNIKEKLRHFKKLYKNKIFAKNINTFYTLAKNFHNLANIFYQNGNTAEAANFILIAKRIIETVNLDSIELAENPNLFFRKLSYVTGLNLAICFYHPIKEVSLLTNQSISALLEDNEIYYVIYNAINDICTKNHLEFNSSIISAIKKITQNMGTNELLGKTFIEEIKRYLEFVSKQSENFRFLAK